MKTFRLPVLFTAAALLVLVAGPAQAQLSDTAKTELKEGFWKIAEEVAAYYTNGETTRGPSGPLLELLKNSDDLICNSWIIGFSVTMRDAAVKNAPVEIQEKLNELRWRIEQFCNNPPPRVGTTPRTPLPPPTTPATPTGPKRSPEQVDEAICRDKCHDKWLAYTTAANAAADAGLKADADAKAAQEARGKLDNLMASTQGLRGDVEGRLKQLGADRLRADVAAADAARAKSAADAASARARRDAAEAAWRACIERCRTQATKWRTPVYAYVAAGAATVVGAVAVSGGGGGSSPPSPDTARIPPPPIAPVNTNPPAPPPPGETPVTTPPTTPAPAPSPGGVYQGSTSVAFDPAGHGPVIQLDQQVALNVTANGTSVTITAQGSPRWIGTAGVIGSDGTFTTTGTGMVAGIAGVAVAFNGRIDMSATPMRITGEYSMGTNGVLPQSQPIRYNVQGQKIAAAAASPR